MIKPRIYVENLTFNIDTMIPCALIINELVTNSLKYAFPNTSRGLNNKSEVRIELRHGADNKYILTVSDNGVGLPEGFQIQDCESLGLKLVRVLVKQLKGSINLNSSNGTEFTIKFRELARKGSMK